MYAGDERPTVLVLAPMPVAPTSAGNRRRLAATCEALHRGKFAVDFAYFQHEDQIYRRFGKHPPTDTAAMAAMFQRTFLIPASVPIPLKTWAGRFSIDAWCPDEAVDFVTWYFATYPDTCAILVNYVFLSRCLQAVPEGVQRIIDTHDRFANRHLQYRPFRTEPNFFYTDVAGEAAGLSRADTVLAIQSAEATYFTGLVDRDVRLLPPAFREARPFRAPRRLARIGFIGHSNDPNLFSIGKFAHAWAAIWRPGLPVLVIAGEICASLGDSGLPGVERVGFVNRIETFYDDIDAVVAPMLMGSGLKIKVAEALSMGRPVVGTRIAFEGFATRHTAHRLDGTGGTVAMIIDLYDDAERLAGLTTACAELLADYNATAETCEAEWLGTIPRRPAPPMPARTGVGPAAPCVADLGPAVVIREHSLRSLRPPDGTEGILVATENLRSAEARASGYTPERRRWFAYAPSAGHAGPINSSAAGLDTLGISVSFATEWVRDRTLGQSTREALASAFGGVQADWTSRGRVVGPTRDALSIVSVAPSFLLSGRRPMAAFLFDAAGTAREARMIDVAPLSRSPNLAFASERGDLTPVPTVWTLVPVEGALLNAPEAERAEGDWPNDPATLLILSDDLIGRVTFTALPADTPMDGDERN